MIISGANGEQGKPLYTKQFEQQAVINVQKIKVHQS